LAREDEIKTIAYGLWEQEGRVHGRDREQWLRAEVVWEARRIEKTAPGGTFTERKAPVQQRVRPPAAKRA
jgi:hypothetical protein